MVEKDDNLVVYFDKVVRDGVYHGLHLGFRPVIVKEIQEKDLATKDTLNDNLKKLSYNKHFLKFYGIDEFQNRSFLIFESYSHDTTQEALFKEALSNEDLFKKLRGLIKAVSWMHERSSLVNFCGNNIHGSSVVVVKNDENQSHLKLFIEGFGHESKTKEDDMRALGEVLDQSVACFNMSNPESDHLIQCLKDSRCKISDLINHPTFWAPERKLDFISGIYGALWDDLTFTQSLLDIQDAVYDNMKETLHYYFVERLEMYGSYSIGGLSFLEILLRMIHDAVTHEFELSNEEGGVGRYYNNCKEGLEEYFRVCFPNLLIEVYKLVERICRPHKGFFFS